MPSFIPLPTAKAGLIRQLSRHKKVRDIERAFLMEGVTSIRDLLQTHASAIVAIVVRTTFIEQVDPAFRQALAESAIPVYMCRDMIFNQLSDLTTSPGILAVVRQPVWDQAAVLNRPVVLGFYGECLQDPANVGAIIRTALAFDLDAVWLSVDSADVFNPKVVRSTSGALMQLPVFAVRHISDFRRHRCTIFASEPPGTTSCPIREIGIIPARTMIALGNESRGLSDDTLKAAALRFHIPTSAGVESLNVAASAAIAVFHFRDLPRKDGLEDFPCSTPVKRR
ncbi:MAG: TrmH family RNA methyltransferase [Nitrospiraceae bacterium]